MSNRVDISGTSEENFQVGIDGARIDKVSDSALAIKNSTGSSLGRLEISNAINANEAMTKQQVEIIASNTIVFTWKYLGGLKNGEMEDGLRILPFAANFTDLILMLGEQGKDDGVIIDINKSSSILTPGNKDSNLTFTSIYTTQSNRPTFIGDNSNKNIPAVYRALTPDIVNYQQYDVFSFDIDDDGKNTKDLIVKLIMTKV